MTDVDTSSYPKPQPPQNPLDQITHIGQAMSSLGDIAVGQSVQGAVQPDGSIDQNALTQQLGSSVAGASKLIPTLTAFQQLRQAGHVADIAGLDDFQKRMAVVNHLFGQLAATDNPSIQDVNSIAARVLDPALQGYKYGLTFPVVMNALKNFRGPDGRPLPPDQIKKRALDMQTMTAETANQLDVLSPKYSVQDDGNTIQFVPTGNQLNPRYPQVTKRIPTGTPVTNPKTRQLQLVPPQPPAPQDYEVDSFGRPLPRRNPVQNLTRAQMGQVEPTPENGLPGTFDERYYPNMRGAPIAGLAPGVAAAATKTAENSAQLGNNLVTAANEVPQTKAILDNLDRTLQGFTPGPGADYRRLGKALVNTVVPDSLKDSLGFDPKSIASQEEFNKLAYQLAQNQFQALGGTGTDAKLDSTMHTSPSELMSKYGIKGVIALLKGNNDALQVKARAWNQWKKQNGEDSYADFSDDFNQHFNPRVFQFQYIPKPDRQVWYRSMSPAGRRDFEDAASYAIQKKWIKPQ